MLLKCFPLAFFGKKINKKCCMAVWVSGVFVGLFGLNLLLLKLKIEN